MNTPNLFCAALGLSLPWRVVSVHFAPGESKERGKLEVRIDFERGSELPCPKCQKACKSYDTDEQSWRHLNFFEHETYLIARVPRVSCEAHGVLKADVPWARPGSGFTLLFEAYVMALAPEIPVAGLARMVGEHDTRLWRVVEWHVADARARVNMSEVVSVVVDETSRAKRYSYVSLFLEPKKLDGEGKVVSDARVLFVTEGRSHDAFHRFVADLKAHGGKPEEVKDVCMDMSPSYQRGAAETLPWAAVTFDRFHVMKLISDALDDVRRLEHKARDPAGPGIEVGTATGSARAGAILIPHPAAEPVVAGRAAEGLDVLVLVQRRDALRAHLPAQPVGFLEQYHAAPGAGRSKRSSDAAGAAAGDQDLAGCLARGFKVRHRQHGNRRIATRRDAHDIKHRIERAPHAGILNSPWCPAARARSAGTRSPGRARQIAGPCRARSTGRYRPAKYPAA